MGCLPIARADAFTIRSLTADPAGSGKLVVYVASQRHGRGHVYVCGDVEVRGLALAARGDAGDGLTHPRQVGAFCAFRGGSRRRRGRRGRFRNRRRGSQGGSGSVYVGLYDAASRAGARYSRKLNALLTGKSAGQRRGENPSSFGGNARCIRRGQHVGLDDPPTGAAAGHRCQVYPAFAGKAAGDGRGADFPSGRGGRGGSWSRDRLGRDFRFGHGGSGTGEVIGQGFVGVADDGDEFAHWHGHALVGDDAAQDAPGSGLEFDHRLIGLYFGDNLIGDHLVALLLDPAHDGAFAHIVTQLRHHNGRSQRCLLSEPLNLNL